DRETERWSGKSERNRERERGSERNRERRERERDGANSRRADDIPSPALGLSDRWDYKMAFCTNGEPVGGGGVRGVGCWLWRVWECGCLCVIVCVWVCVGVCFLCGGVREM